MKNQHYSYNVLDKMAIYKDNQRTSRRIEKWTSWVAKASMIKSASYNKTPSKRLLLILYGAPLD